MVIPKADKFGECVCCGENLIQDRIVDGKVIKMFSPYHEETTVLLNDGSQMRICTCKDCKESFTAEDYKQIMQNVKDGWQLEVKDLVADESKPEWTQEKADKYMKDYGQKEILGVLN